MTVFFFFFREQVKRYILQILTTAVLVVLTVIIAAADSGGTASTTDVTFVEMTPAAERAIERGLAYMASRQAKNGSWGASRSGGDTGITALAGLAFLAGGHLPDRGKYGSRVSKAVDYIIKNTRDDGFITSGHSNMYAHGFATLFLAEVYGTTRSPKVKETLIRAVGLIEGTQSPKGGWRYNPVPLDADISVTICQIMALRAARNSGIKVQERVIKNGIKYIKYCQCKDGGFGYTGPTSSGFARTAAGVCSLYYAGEYEDSDKSIRRGLDYLFRMYAKGGTAVRSHFFYGNYYAAQAMFQAGGKYWQSYFPKMRDELVKMQTSSGAWGRSSAGVQHGTPMACIILQVPYRYLPVLQR